MPYMPSSALTSMVEANIPIGVALKFQRTPTTHDVDTIKKNLPNAGLAHIVGNSIILRVESTEEQTTLMKAFEGAVDQGHPIGVEAWGKSVSSGPITFGPKLITFGASNLLPAPTTPSPEAVSAAEQQQATAPRAATTPDASTDMQCDALAPIDPRIEQRFTQFSERMDKFDASIQSIGGKLDALLNDKKNPEAKMRPRDEDPQPLVEQTHVWCVLRSGPMDSWRPYKTMIIKVNDAGTHFQGLPFHEDGLPAVNMQCELSGDYAMAEQLAKSLA